MAALGHAAPLQQAAVAEFEHVASLCLGIVRQGLEPGAVSLRLTHPLGHVGMQGGVVALHQQGLRYGPQVHKALVEGADLPAQGAHQHAVGGRVQRRTQFRQQGFQLSLGGLAGGAVGQGDEQCLRMQILRARHHPLLHRHQGAVTPQQLRLAPGALGQRLCAIGPEALVLRSGGKPEHGLAHQLVRRHAHERCGHGIRKEDGALLQVHQPDPLLQAVKSSQHGHLRACARHTTASRRWESTARSKK